MLPFILTWVFFIKTPDNFWKPSREFQETVRLVPKNREALTNLGEVYLNMEALDEAIKVLARAVSCDPQFADAHLQLGKVYIKRKWWDEALVELKKAQEIKPGFK